MPNVVRHFPCRRGQFLPQGVVGNWSVNALEYSFQINLVRIALEVGAVDKARQHLAMAEQLNKAGYYDTVIADLKNRVAALH
ncbi:MAG: hypothetical protein U1F23_06805 [Lysobacterales bacterium]